MPRSPRPYQHNCFDAIRDAFRRGVKHVIVELATGLGKTVIFSLITKMTREKGGRVLILVNRDVLVGQAIEELIENGVYCEREQAGDRASITADVVVASVQSMSGKWIDKYRNGYFSVVITDECHGSAAKTFRAILDHHDSSFHVGVTATAERHDGKGLWKGYQDIVYRMPLKTWTEKDSGLVIPGGIDEGWLCGFDFNELPVPITLEDSVAMGNKLTEQQEEDVFEAGNYLPRLFAEASDVARNRKGLAFWPGTKASARAADEMRKNGVNAQHIDGYMSLNERKRLLRWFAECKEGVLCNSDLLMVGYNQPDINWLGMFRIFRSTPMFKQALGRGTRTIAPVDSYETKEQRLIAIANSAKPFVRVDDLMIQNEDHNLATPSCLITDDPEERHALDKAAKGSGRAMSLDDLDDKLRSHRIIDAEKQLEKLANDAANRAYRGKQKGPYVNHILRMRRPPNAQDISSAQARYLKSLGFDGPMEGLSKFQGMKLIDAYIKHSKKAA